MGCCMSNEAQQGGRPGFRPKGPASATCITDVPEVAEKYEKVRELGSGAFGSVILVRERATGREFAMKEILETKGTVQERSLSRQASEATMMSKIRYTGAGGGPSSAVPVPQRRSSVVGMYERFKIPPGNGRKLWASVIVMELLPGGSLQNFVFQQAPLAEARVAKWGMQVASALAHVHECGFMHRDVGAANVMVDGDDNACLVDFGCACKKDDPAHGLPRLAPEALAPPPSPRPHDQRVDHFELGLMLLELCTRSPADVIEVVGHPASIAEMRTRGDAAVARYVDRGLKGYSGKLRDVLKGLMRIKPAQRLSLVDAAEQLTELMDPKDRPDDAQSDVGEQGSQVLSRQESLVRLGSKCVFCIPGVSTVMRTTPNGSFEGTRKDSRKDSRNSNGVGRIKLPASPSSGDSDDEGEVTPYDESPPREFRAIAEQPGALKP